MTSIPKPERSSCWINCRLLEIQPRQGISWGTQFKYMQWHAESTLNLIAALLKNHSTQALPQAKRHYFASPKRHFNICPLLVVSLLESREDRGKGLTASLWWHMGSPKGCTVAVSIDLLWKWVWTPGWVSWVAGSPWICLASDGIQQMK